HAGAADERQTTQTSRRSRMVESEESENVRVDCRADGNVGFIGYIHRRYCGRGNSRGGQAVHRTIADGERASRSIEVHKRSKGKWGRTKADECGGIVDGTHVREAKARQ